MRSGVTEGIAMTVPDGPVPILTHSYGPNLSFLRQAPGLRPEPLALHGRHQAPVRREPPEGPHRRERRAEACVRLHALPQGRQGHEGVTSAGGPSLRGPQGEIVIYWPTPVSSGSARSS